MITLEEIYQGLAAEFQAQTGKTAGSSSELAVRFYAVAAQIYSLYVQGEWTRRQCFPQTASGEDLDKHAKLRNVTRRQAAKATGTVCFYVGQPQETGTEIAKGTVCMTAAGVRFLTTETVTVEAEASYAEAPVIADEAGAAGKAVGTGGFGFAVRRGGAGGPDGGDGHRRVGTAGGQHAPGERGAAVAGDAAGRDGTVGGMRA